VRHLRSILALTVAAAGCSPSTAVAIEGVGQSPGASVSSGQASLPVGVVLGFQVTARSSAVVTASVDDPTLATVAPTTQATEFVVIGLATGETTLHVFVDNQDSIDMPVQVTGPAP
jgi:Pilus formation protein N terminal region